MNRKWTFILTAVSLLLVLLYMGIGYYFSSVVIAVPFEDDVPDLAPFLAEHVPQLSVENWTQHTVPSGDVSLAATFFENETDAECAVMLLHGYSSHRYSMLLFAPIFWERGCDILVYDARGHGSSDDALHTFGFYEKQDAVAMLGWLKQQTGLDSTQIGVMGASYGAATALQLLELDPDLAFVIADSPYQSWREIVTYQGEQQYGEAINGIVPSAVFWIERRGALSFDAVSPETAVRNQTAPILLLHALHDDFTPSTHSEAIYANSDQTITELHLTDWNPQHGVAFHGNVAGYMSILERFLEDKAPTFGNAQ